MTFKPRTVIIALLATIHSALLFGEVNWRSFLASMLLLGLIILCCYDLKKDGII